jgi:maltooligosyltrehalose trehalohydrolase
MKFPIAGAIPEKDTCTFTVWAPLRKNIELVLHPDQTVHPMNRDPLGYWQAKLPTIAAGTQYFFRIDGDKILPDPASRFQPEGVHGPSEVVAPDFDWQDGGWTGLSLADMVIYEIHVGTFTSSRDFEGIIQKLPYLVSLGVNAIELMPLSQFPGDRNWGYDGVYPFAVQNSYGGPRGLKKLVDAAHLSGIAVIVDVVYNHQGPEGNYLGEFGPYFTEKYKTGWGRAINFDDAWCDGVRNFYWQNALMWLDEFHVDGLRLDAVHAIWDFSANHFVEELARRVRALERASGRKKVLIAEFDLNNPRYIRPFDKGGYNLDGQWIDEFHHALHSLITGEVDGYYEDFGDSSHLAKAFKDSYVYTGQFSAHRKKHFGRPPEGTTFDQFVVFAQNHDQIGNRMLGDRLSSSLGHEALKLAAAAYLLSPSVPMLFMGEEYGEKNPFQYFISHTDEKLVEAVRKGRREEFAYFKWEGEVPDPQSEKTFESCMLSWDHERSAEAKALFSFYQHLIQLRKSRTALQGKTRDTLEVRSYENNILCIERTYEDDNLLIVLNFNKEQSPFTFAEKKLKVVLNSASSQWGGPLSKDNQQPTGMTYQLHPESVVIFEP